MNSRATEDLLDQLHGMQCEQLIKYLKDLKDNKAEYTPAMFSQINKYLKDNGVDRPFKPGNPTDLLSKELDDFDTENVSLLHGR